MAVTIDGTNGITTVGIESTADATVKDVISVSGSTSGTTKAIAANSTATEVWHYVGSSQTHFRAHDDSANLMTIDSSGRVKMPYQPAFYAYRDAGNISGNSDIVFNVTHVNTGSHYNSSTGRFTAPVDGTYEFSVHAMSVDTRTAYISLMINGTQKTGCNPYSEKTSTILDTGWYMQAAGTFIVNLSASDYVYIRNNSTSALFGGNSNAHNGFSGKLIG